MKQAFASVKDQLKTSQVIQNHNIRFSQTNNHVGYYEGKSKEVIDYMKGLGYEFVSENKETGALVFTHQQLREMTMVRTNNATASEIAATPSATVDRILGKGKWIEAFDSFWNDAGTKPYESMKGNAETNLLIKQMVEEGWRPGEKVEEKYIDRLTDDKKIGKVDGLFEAIDINHKPLDVQFADQIDVQKNTKTITTKVFPQRGGNPGVFIRTYDLSDPQNPTLIFEEGFINDAPRWIKDVKIPLDANKGIPTQAYVTLRQMKLLGIADGSLKTAKLSTVQRAETMLFVTRLMENENSTDFSVIGSRILTVSSVEYAKTTLVQAGYLVTTGAVKSNKYTRQVTIKEARDIHGINELTDALIKKYNYTEDSKIYIHFDVYFTLESIK